MLASTYLPRVCAFLHNSRMWPNLLSLMVRAWANVLSSLGTTTLSIALFCLAVPVVTFVVTLLVIWKNNGQAGFVESARKTIIPTIIGLAVPITMIFCVFCWRIVTTVYDDHRQFVENNRELRQRLSECKKSGLNLLIGNMATGRDVRSKTGFVMIFASISNLGPPSIVDQWKLEVTYSSGQRKTYQPVILVSGIVPILDTKGASVTYNPNDLLYRKTASSPIATGAKVSGYLLFDLRPITQEEADIPGTIYHLSAVDVYGNPISAQVIWTANFQQDAVPYMPGAEEPKVKRR